MKKEVIIVLGILIVVLGGYFIRLQGEESIESATQQQEADALNQVQDTNTRGGEVMTYTKPPEMVIDESKNYSAVVKTSEGDLTVELTASETPKTVNNFIFLAREGFYDGTIFHRVIKDFMIQGGDPDGTGAGGPGYTFEDEITPDQAFDGPGILAMANRGPDTNGSQFFITHAETPWLSGAHTIFGRVTDGMDVVDAIANAETKEGDKPVQDITIQSIEIIEN